MGFKKTGDFKPPKIHLESESLIGGAIQLQNMLVIRDRDSKYAWEMLKNKMIEITNQINTNLGEIDISTYFNIFQPRM